MRLRLCVFLLFYSGSPPALLAGPKANPGVRSDRYAVTDLGALRLFPRSYGSRPMAVNDKGQVALNSVNEGQAAASVASLWDNGKTVRVTDFPAQVRDVEAPPSFPVYTRGMRLNTFPTGPWSEALGLNNKGQIVGSYYTSINPWSRAFVFWKGRMTLLTSPTGAQARAFGINDAGQVVGRVDFADGTRHAFLWTQGRPTDLPTLGGKYSEANAINAVGAAAGMSSLPDGSLHAVLWDRGGIHDLHPPGFKASQAAGINSRGQIVGTLTLADGSRHACLWTQGKAIDLGTLGGRESEADGINDAGRVVGSADIGVKVSGYNQVPHAFIWDSKNGLRDLNTLVAAPALPVPGFPTAAPEGASSEDLWYARGINNKGQIIAHPPSGHARLLTPIP